MARPLQILLAEDDELSRKFAFRPLGKRGHIVATVSNGREVLEALDREGFDLVLMDMQMPEMDGLEATAATRARERATGKHIPVVAMTVYAMKGDRERCLQAGVDDYLAKPIRPAELFECIGRLSQASKLRPG